MNGPTGWNLRVFHPQLGYLMLRVHHLDPPYSQTLEHLTVMFNRAGWDVEVWRSGKKMVTSKTVVPDQWRVN